MLLRCIATEHLFLSPRAWLFGKGSQKCTIATGEQAAQGHPTAVVWTPAEDQFILALTGSLVLCNSQGRVLDIAALTHGEPLSVAEPFSTLKLPNG